MARLYRRYTIAARNRRTQASRTQIQRYRLSKAMVLRNPRPKAYSFKRKLFVYNNIELNYGTDYAGVFNFRLDQLPNYSDFQNLYDQYMIKKIVFKIIPKYSESALVTGGATTGINPNNQMQQIHSCIDYDDNTLPTSVDQLCQYQTHKMTRGNLVHTRVFVPKCEINVTSSAGVASANAPKAYQWLDCDAPTIPHNGIKVFIPAPGMANTRIQYDILTTYYISCKGVV